MKAQRSVLQKGKDGKNIAIPINPPVSNLGTPPVSNLGTPPVSNLGTPPVANLGTPPVANLGTPLVNEKMINVNRWKINDTFGYYLVTYTATWCGPCQRAKPHLLKTVEGTQHLGSKEIGRTKRPKHVKFIPWFDVLDSSDKIIESLQSSDPKQITQFIQKYRFVEF